MTESRRCLQCGNLPDIEQAVWVHGPDWIGWFCDKHCLFIMIAVGPAQWMLPR